MATDQPDELSELPDEARAGRGFPFAMVGDFVALAEIPDKSKLLYWYLRMHINQQSQTNKVFPLRATLAQLLGLAPGKKGEEAVTKYLRPLQDLKAVDVETHRYGANRMKRRNIYIVHVAPPEDHKGLAALKDFYEQRNS